MNKIDKEKLYNKVTKLKKEKERLEEQLIIANRNSTKIKIQKMIRGIRDDIDFLLKDE